MGYIGQWIVFWLGLAALLAPAVFLGWWGVPIYLFVVVAALVALGRRNDPK